MFGVNTVADSLILNIEIDESIFETDVPDEFELDTIKQKPVNVEIPKNPTRIDDKTLLEGFHGWVLLSGGTFPSTMTMDAIKDLDPQASIIIKQAGWGFQTRLNKKIDLDSKKFGFTKENPISEEEKKELVSKLQTAMNKAFNGFLAVFRLPADSDWHYAGKDVIMGDADKVIFWYRPKDSTTYRVIYGDLTVKDMPPESLPR